MGNKWMAWTVLEALMRSMSNALQKTIDDITAVSFSYVLYATGFIGLVQMVAGFVVLRSRGKKIGDQFANIAGSISFGVFGVLSICLSFLVFAKGGQLSVHAFITSLSIIPGALIDLFVFKHPLSKRQWIGVMIAVVAGYVVLGLPSFDQALKLPFWVWCSFGAMMAMTVNQGITQRIKDVDPFVKNFWGGATIFILGFGVLLAFGKIPVGSYPYKLTLISLAIGGLSVILWIANLFAYRDGALMAIKKLIMSGSYLLITIVGGAVIFGEEVGLHKIIAFFLYLFSFLLLDNPTWEYFWIKNTALLTIINRKN